MSARFSAMRPAQLAALALVLTAASAQGQSAWAYADVYYDAATDRVIANTTTLVDYSTEYYYSPKVQVSLSGSDGSYAWWYCPYAGAGACTNGNYAYGDVFVSAAPGVTYTVQGFHSVETYYYYYDMDPGCTWGCYNWYDALGYSTGSCSPACQADPNCFCVEVLGVPYNRSYLAPWILHLVYVASQPLGDTSKQATTQQALLSCTPSAVTRGSNVNCTVSGPGSTRVTDWSFTGGGGNVSGPPGVTWGGTMVQSGTVSAKAGGLPTQPASFNITVNSRSGWETAAATAQKVSPAFEPPCGPFGVPEYPHYLQRVGAACLAQQYPPTPATVSGGPNQGFHYVQSIQNNTTFHWAMNASLENPASVFYNAQCGNYNPQSNPYGFISGANLSANVRRHESGDLQSHYRFYTDAQNSSPNNPARLAEPFVGVPAETSDSFRSRLNVALTQAANSIFASTSVEPCGNSDPGYNGSCVFQGFTNLYPLPVPNCPNP